MPVVDDDDIIRNIGDLEIKKKHEISVAIDQIGKISFFCGSDRCCILGDSHVAQ